MILYVISHKTEFLFIKQVILESKDFPTEVNGSTHVAGPRLELTSNNNFSSTLNFQDGFVIICPSHAHPVLILAYFYC